MVGPVEVEQVTHVFSQETGFITEIVPDMCIGLNEWSTLGTVDAMGLVAEEAILGMFFNVRPPNISAPGTKNWGEAQPMLGVSRAAMALALYFSPTSFTTKAIGLFSLYKFTEISQFRNPITFAPLMYKGRPYTAGVRDRSKVSNWVQLLGKYWNNGFEGIQIALEDLSDWLYVAPSRGNIWNDFGDDTTGPSFRR